MMRPERSRDIPARGQFDDSDEEFFLADHARAREREMATEDGMKCDERVSVSPEMKRRKPNWRVSSVLDRRLSEEPHFVPAIVATVKDKKSLAGVMQELAKMLPLPEFAHLKRIRGCDVILGSAEALGERYLEQMGLSGSVVERLGQIRRESVPRDTPTLRWQFEMASKWWPCKFHPDKQLELLHSNQIFSNHQVNFHISVMEICLRLSDKRTNPAVVVDPRDGAIVTVAWSRVEKHPLGHTPMVAIDSVARSQNGGVWPAEDAAESTEILHSVRQQLKSLACDGGDCGNLSKFGPYLCTGFDLYVLQEPCLMCAMALIHSRVRRVFFHRQSPSGALMSTAQLHTIKELNHHYQVFRID
ncbi:probable inactive tRNA-specific adenosine deaminase-like protein 3 [Phlebotomus argentipes]|uniref:probable inactive tRNA-specific adenosine deaminase-like protein 3 n=1 Tax=Phlebotomus argentipes TaxID=94469 RepID=UPI0028934DDF|nr:probable inactive tRNA-specific adenosine deaminase-like protein 3 [Phlebotomus argentipes]